MTRVHSIALATLAAVGFALPAAAQDRAAGTANNDAKAVVPSKEDLKPMRPSTQTLDDNAQRAHDRDRGTGSAAGGNAGSSSSTVAAGNAGGNQAVRDWGAIDRNNDNLIQPEEMEAALKEVGPQAKK